MAFGIPFDFDTRGGETLPQRFRLVRLIHQTLLFFVLSLSLYFSFSLSLTLSFFLFSFSVSLSLSFSLTLYLSTKTGFTLTDAF